VIRTTLSRDQRRYEKLIGFGCVACFIARNPTEGGKIEMHHLVDKGYRKHSGGNQATLPLCAWHHRGEPLIDHTAQWMKFMYGPSMALESKSFAERYGSQRELLAKVDSAISGKRGIAE
jgi:hypothetical protein